MIQTKTLKNILLMLEPDGSVEIAREYISSNYVEHITISVISVGVIIGIALLLNFLYNVSHTINYYILSAWR